MPPPDVIIKTPVIDNKGGGEGEIGEELSNGGWNERETQSIGWP